jgi:hypothetical protein
MLILVAVAAVLLVLLQAAPLVDLVLLLFAI